MVAQQGGGRMPKTQEKNNQHLSMAAPGCSFHQRSGLLLPPTTYLFTSWYLIPCPLSVFLFWTSSESNTKVWRSLIGQKSRSLFGVLHPTLTQSAKRDRNLKGRGTHITGSACSFDEKEMGAELTILPRTISTFLTHFTVSKWLVLIVSVTEPVNTWGTSTQP